jgi:hypothetical protein
MKTKYFLMMIVAAIAVCIAAYVPVVSAGPADAAGASLTGAIKFEGSALKPTRIDM